MQGPGRIRFGVTVVLLNAPVKCFACFPPVLPEPPTVDAGRCESINSIKLQGLNIMKHFRAIALLLALTTALSPLASAQTATGSVSGSIHDANGAAVPGARVSARNDATGVALATQSSEAGVYVFPTVPVGVYTISVEKDGFKKATRTGLEIRVAMRQEQDLTLEVGDVQQSVEVTADAQLLETVTPQRGQNFSPQMMNNLPLFTGGIRNPQAFISYMPGVSVGTPETSISGSGGRAAEILMDGASFTIPESGGAVFNFPSAEMFSEFKLLTGTYDAEYGRFGGGVQIFVTKSGTNDIHGSAFLNLRRDIWNANTWARNWQGLPRQKERFNEVGGSAGGPVFIPKVYDGRNKTFWYFTYSKDMRPVSITGTPVTTVPTALMRQGIFSELPANQIIYDPLTTSGNTRTPFPNQTIPQDRFSQISRNLLSAVPMPTRPGTTNNFDFTNTQVVDRYIWNLKFDHAFNPGNRLSFTMTKENGFTNDTNFFPGPLGQGLLNFQRPDNWRGNHDWVIKPNILLHTTFGFSRTRQGWSNPNQAGAGSAFGFPGLSGDSDALPRIQFEGPDVAASSANAFNWGVQDGKVNNGGQNNYTYHFAQGLSWILGRHELKFGWDYRVLQTTAFDLAGTNGLYRFARNQTALPTATGSTGHVYASMLLGMANSAERTALPVLFPDIRYGYVAGYIQDNFRVNNRFSLRLGMRYEVPKGWAEANGDYSSVNLTLPNPAAGGLPGAYEFYGSGQGRTGQLRPYPTDYSNIAPRIGFAYKFTEKTVLRGGYGTYFQTLGNGGCGCRDGFASPYSRLSDGVNAAVQWDGGLAPPPDFQPPPTLSPTIQMYQSVSTLSQYFGRAPRIHEWSLTLQHQLGQFVFEAGYVGNRGSRLASTQQINQNTVDNLALGTLLRARIDSPEAAAAGITKPFADFPDNMTVAQALRPFPQYLDVANRNSGQGRTWYDAAQFKVERRFGDWQMMASYTYSKALSVAHYRQIFSQTQVTAQDNYNYDEMKSISPFNQPHIFNILNTYNLPFGRGKKFANSDSTWVNLLVGNWTISAIQQYRSGAPLAVSAPNTLGAGTLFTNYKKALRNPGDIQTGIDRGTLDPNNPDTRWFNPGVFAIPGEFQLGNAAQYITEFRQPTVLNENISIVKTLRFPVGGDRNIDLQLRSDAFNVFNRTSFGGVNGVVGNPNFGRPSGPQNGARLITMGLRATF